METMVDIVHHGIIGVAGAGVASALGQPEMAVGFLLGSLLPDLDVLFIALGKSRFLRLHQGVTHSLAGIPVIGALAAAIFASLAGISFVPMAMGIIAGMALHVILDLMNTFGVRILWPLPRRISLDAFFFIDAYVLGASLLFAWAAWFGSHPVAAAAAWAGLVSAYAAARVLQRRRIVAEHRLTTAVPSGIFPLTWFVTRREHGLVRTGVVEGLGGCLRWTGTVAEADQTTLAVLRTGPAFADLEAALKMFVPVSVAAEGETKVVLSRCVAVPNFGNRYGETRSVIAAGKVISEDSRI
jgi:inner membrane protein